jgi:hypothetical protein
VIEFRSSQGELVEMKAEEWLAFSKRSLLVCRARKQCQIDGNQHRLGLRNSPRHRTATTRCRGGLDYAIAKSLAAAPFADILWMETNTADLAEAREFAEAIHAEFPDKMLAYNLSPSFNWDTTGMSDDQMKRFPEELGKLGFVFNFITYGGHQIDGLAAEEFATALKQDGMLSLARLQREFRLLESPYRTPQTLVRRPSPGCGPDGLGPAEPPPPRRWAKGPPSISTWYKPKCRRASAWRIGSHSWAECHQVPRNSARAAASGRGRIRVPGAQHLERGPRERWPM